MELFKDNIRQPGAHKFRGKKVFLVGKKINRTDSEGFPGGQIVQAKNQMRGLLGPQEEWILCMN